MLVPPENLVPDPDCFAILSTPRGPGAIAVVDLIGDVQAGLARLFPERPPQVGSLSHRRFGDFDDGVVALLTEDRAQICPHGGVAMLDALRGWLDAHKIDWLEDASGIDPTELFPEAGDRVEAFAMAALTRAASYLAVPLLLAQSAAWHATPPNESDRPRSLRLRRLLVPPRVVVAGAPNAGKSSLANAIVGRTVAITSPEPGTTRDHVAARVDLEGLVVDWFDTPGIRVSDDPIEQEALTLAMDLIASADLLIAVAEPGKPWPHLPREPDLRVRTKAELLDAQATSEADAADAADMCVSAHTGAGLAELVALARERLVPEEDLEDGRPWIFNDRLFETFEAPAPSVPEQ
jgi:tRNA modification GTPase